MLNTILSILLLFLLSPLMIAVVIIILLDDGFPVFLNRKGSTITIENSLFINLEQ